MGSPCESLCGKGSKNECLHSKAALRLLHLIHFAMVDALFRGDATAAKPAGAT